MKVLQLTWLGLKLVFASKLMSNPTLLSNSANTMPSEVKQILPVNSLFLVTVNKGMVAPTGKLSLQKYQYLFVLIVSAISPCFQMHFSYNLHASTIFLGILPKTLQTFFTPIGNPSLEFPRTTNKSLLPVSADWLIK